MRLESLLFLVCLTSAAWALTDCEVCGIISPIYGACSPQLVELYANKTGLGPVEWLCLKETSFTSPANSTLNSSPIHTLEMMNYTISLFTDLGNIVIKPSRTFDTWGFKQNGDQMDLWINFNSSLLSTSKASFEIYSAFALARNGTNLSYGNNLFVKFADSTPITSAEAKPYGWLVDTSFTSRTGKYNISFTIGKVDVCAMSCFPPDVYYVDVSINQSSTLVGQKFSDGWRWLDALGTCATTGGCIGSYRYGAATCSIIPNCVAIPITSATDIDCNGVSCRTGLDPAKNTWFYKDIRCRSAVSGKVIANFFLTTYSEELDYQCNATAAPSAAVTKQISDDDEDIQKPNFPYIIGVGIVGTGIMCIAGVGADRQRRKKEGKNAA